MKTPVYWSVLVLILLWSAAANSSATEPLRITVLGDSLVAGFGLNQGAAFPARLEMALKQRNYPVVVVNAGISGDTSAGGLARLNWTLDKQPDLMIVELGANDALRGLNPLQTERNLNAILTRLRAAGVQVLLAGMKAPRNLGEDYYTKFDQLYPKLARRHQVPLYPFFLQGVAGDPALNQADGIHPTAAGVEVIVRGILPLVEEVLDGLLKDRPSRQTAPGATGTHRGGLQLVISAVRSPPAAKNRPDRPAGGNRSPVAPR